MSSPLQDGADTRERRGTAPGSSVQCGLHNHSEGSALDGYAKVWQMAKRIRELGQTAGAITDHGEVNQHLAFQKACRQEGVKPLFGMEGYWAPDIKFLRDYCKGENSGKWGSMMSHICLIAKTNDGLRNLWALSSKAYDEDHFFHRPMADPALMREYAADMYGSDGCFVGSERFTTLTGTKTFAETVGTTQKVLGRPGRSPVWVDAEIRSFGVQQVVELTLIRDGRRKTIQTTANHRWFVRRRKRPAAERLTSGLQPGDRLVSLGPPVFTGRTTPSAVGIQAGLVFGDGTVDVGDTGRRSARIKLYGSKDAQLLKWFPLQPTTACATEDAIEVRGLPGYFKDTPSLTDSSLGYLYGWLAGYFAADGCVTSDGSAQLASARLRDIQLVRDICQILGIRTGAIRTVERDAPLPQGGSASGALYYVTLDVTHLRTEFFLIDSHRERVAARQIRRHQRWSDWRVESVHETDRFEKVFCAVVPRGQAFTLEDDIFTGNCIMTGLGQAVEAGDEDGARQYLGTLQSIFDDRFYVELHTWQHMNPSDDDWVTWGGEPITTVAANKKMTDLNQAKVRLATEMGIPMVVVNDAHHAYPEHWKFKEMVWGFKKDNNPDQQEGSGQKADHIMGDDELYYWMDRHGVSRNVVAEAIKYSGQIAEQCNVEITPMLSMPQFTQSEADDFELFLDHVERGFKDKVERGGLDRSRYWTRMESEVALIAQKRFAGYFLVVEDYVKAAREGTWAQYVTPGSPLVPMMIGPGRGSAGGSLVAWLLGITSIDPLKYGLLFERFLAPGRKGYPDIDIDFPRSKRKGVRDYVRKRWGEDRVCSISTMTRNQAKASVWDLARSLGIDNVGDLTTIAKLVDNISKNDWEEEGGETAGEDDKSWPEIMEEHYQELSPWIRKYPELFDNLKDVHGIIRTWNVHAAAVLISKEPFAGRIPTRIKNGTLMTQFDMYAVEELGGLKGDFLALRHLDALEITRDLVKDRHGIEIDYEGFDAEWEDPDIWEQIDDGQTVGIFQIGTPGGTDSAIEFRPRSMVDVADLISINRPGVRDAGLYNVYLRRRAGQEAVTYDHPLMESITKDTYGVLVYQEQLMHTARELAGFTPDEADDLRKAVGKKLMDKVLALKQKFIQGCQNNPDYALACGDPVNQVLHPEREVAIAEKIWASIEASGRYCVVGDTRVKLSNGDEMTVADMYRRLTDDRRLEGRPCWYGCRFTGYRGKCQTCRVWRQKFRDSRGLKAWSLGHDGRLHPNRIVDVYRNGVQPAWRVTLENGDSITATADHRHMTSRGWREVRELAVGDELLVCGQYERQAWEPDKIRTTRGEPAYAGARLPNSQRNGPHSLGYIDGGYLALKEWTSAQEWVCSELGCTRSRAAGDRIERAHLDGDRTNNDPTNLAMKCASHHKAYDYRVNGRWARGEKGYPVIPTKIVSVEYVGEEMVYDLSMSAPRHSWVGNNIVTHNCFNKSHAIGYAMIATWEIWVKHYYPAEFLVACMQVDEVRRNKFIRDARRRDIAILPPDINLSGQNFTIEGNSIRYGLQAIHGIGEAAANALVAKQPYTSLEDFLGRGKPNKTAVVALAKLGSLDCFGQRAQILKEVEYYRATKDLAKSTLGNPEKLAKILNERFTKPEYVIDIPNFADKKVVYEIEQQLVGTFVTIDPMGDYLKIIDAECIRSAASLRNYLPGQKLCIGGQIVKKREVTIKRGRQTGKLMCFLGVEWQGENYDITLFPPAYDRYKMLLKMGAPVICGCERLAPRDDRDGGVSLLKLFRLDIELGNNGDA